MAWTAWAYLGLQPADAGLVAGGFSTLREAWDAPLGQLTRAGLAPAIAAAIVERRRSIDPLAILDQLERLGVRFCARPQSDYPALLRHIHDPPLGLFYRGEVAEAKPTLAVVGTRRASDYALQVTSKICCPLAGGGITVVSGLALGVDTAAHQAALEAGGRTIAVLGGGIDDQTVYPPSNRKLAATIAASGGCVVSEYPPGTPPLPFRFPLRNRIIAGLSLGTLVVEAPLKSGALITARVAIEENREVLAVPGRTTDENAAGPLALIRNGAAMVRDADDVCAVFGWEPQPAASRAAALPADHAAVVAALGVPLPRELLQQRCGLSAQQLSAALTQLEVSGAIRRLPSGKFYRTDMG